MFLYSVTQASLSLANVKKIIAFPAFNFVHNIAGETCDFAIDSPRNLWNLSLEMSG